MWDNFSLRVCAAIVTASGRGGARASCCAVVCSPFCRCAVGSLPARSAVESRVVVLSSPLRCVSQSH